MWAGSYRVELNSLSITPLFSFIVFWFAVNEFLEIFYEKIGLGIICISCLSSIWLSNLVYLIWLLNLDKLYLWLGIRIKLCSSALRFKECLYLGLLFWAWSGPCRFALWNEVRKLISSILIVFYMTNFYLNWMRIIFPFYLC